MERNILCTNQLQQISPIPEGCSINIEITNNLMFKASTFLLLLRSYAIGQEPMKSMYPSVGPSRSGCIESLTSWTEQEIFSVQNIRYLQRDDMQYITCIPSNQYMKNDLTFDDMQDILHSKPFNCLTPSKAMQVAASSAISIYLRLFLHIIILLKKTIIFVQG